MSDKLQFYQHASSHFRRHKKKSFVLFKAAGYVFQFFYSHNKDAFFPKLVYSKFEFRMRKKLELFQVLVFQMNLLRINFYVIIYTFRMLELAFLYEMFLFSKNKNIFYVFNFMFSFCVL